MYLRGFISRKVTIKSCEIHYFEKRAVQEKGVILLVHGMGASAAHFDRVAVALHQAGYTIFAIDLPGHGLSSDSDGPLTPDMLYELFLEWASRILPDPFIFLGNSLGGSLGIRFAAENAHRIQRLVLISPGGGFDHEDDWKQFKSSLSIQNLEHSKTFIHKIYHRMPFYVPMIYKSFLKTMARSGIRQLIEHTNFSDFQFDKTFLNSFPPTLLIWGQSEKLFPMRHLERFKKLLPESVVFEEPPQVGHCPHLDNAGWLVDRMIRLIEEGDVPSDQVDLDPSRSRGEVKVLS